jgi:hypothetical protein
VNSDVACKAVCHSYCDQQAQCRAFGYPAAYMTMNLLSLGWRATQLQCYEDVKSAIWAKELRKFQSHPPKYESLKENGSQANNDSDCHSHISS